MRVDELGRAELPSHVDSLGSAADLRVPRPVADDGAGELTPLIEPMPVVLRLDDAPGMSLHIGLSAVATIKTR